MWLQFLNNHKTCTRNMKGIMTAYLVKKKKKKQLTGPDVKL